MTKLSPQPNQIPEQDSPAVLAYRVGQLEITTKTGFETVTTELKALGSSFATIEDHNDLKKRVTKLESRDGIKQTLLWVGLVASAIINIVTTAKIFSVL